LCTCSKFDPQRRNCLPSVTGSTSLDLGGSIGTRSAWTLAFPRIGSPLPPDPMTTMASTIPITNNFGFALTFNYDQTSDLLLSASADIHLGFGEETFIPPAPCSPSSTTAPALTVCPATPYTRNEAIRDRRSGLPKAHQHNSRPKPATNTDKWF